MTFIVIDMPKKTAIQILDEYTEISLKGYWKQLVKDVKIKNIKWSFKSLLLIVVIYMLSLVISNLYFNYIKHTEVIIAIFGLLHILFIYHLLIFLECVINYFID